jgi:hypothetical protein
MRHRCPSGLSGAGSLREDDRPVAFADDLADAGEDVLGNRIKILWAVASRPPEPRNREYR